MAGPNLPENVDATYADDGGDPSRQLHQAAHDAIHNIVNEFDTAIGTANDNDVLMFNSVTGLYEPAAVSDTTIAWQGSWVTSTAYAESDAVENDGTSYICTSAHTSGATTEPGVGASWTSVWDILAAKGDQGVQGIQGDEGAQGPAGVDGATGPAGPSAELRSVITTGGAAQLLDANAASIFDITLTADCTITLDGPTECGITLFLRQSGAGSWEVTWPAGLLWPAATGPTLSTTAGKCDIVTLIRNGGEWYGAYIIDYSPAAESFPTINVELMGTINTGTDGTSYQIQPVGGAVGDPVTIASRDLVFLCVLAPLLTLDAINQPTITGGGVTWTTPIHEFEWVSGTQQRQMSLFAVRSDSPGAPAAVSISYGAQTVAGCTAIMVKVPGTPSTAVAIADGNTDDNTGTGTSLALTLAAAADAANRPIAFFSIGASATDLVQETDWTEVTELHHTSPSDALMCCWKSSAFDTSPTASWATAYASGGIACEIEQG